MADTNAASESVLQKNVVYDGEGYTREGLQGMVTTYQDRHRANVKSLELLSKAHDDLSAEMTKDLVKSKSALEYLGNIVKFHQVGTNLHGLLEKVPIIGDALPDRPLNELLEEKVEVAQRRVQEVGNYLDTTERQITDLQTDIVRLNKKMVIAAVNEERAAKYVLELQQAAEAIDGRIAAFEDPKSVQARTLQSERDEIKKLIWEHGAKLRLYSNAEDRISSIVNMNNNFLEILRNLHANMQALYDSGNEVLNELQGNLAGLATAAKASDLTIEMQQAMDSLKKSVNKIAVLASETSFYLTQNVERLTSGMKIYDDATRELVESNLAAEREMKEKRIDETIALARKEYGHFEQARGEVNEAGA